MAPLSRLCAAALLAVAALLGGTPLWAAGTVGPSGEVIQPGAPIPGAGTEEPPSNRPDRAAPPGRADVNADGLSDSLEALLDQAGPGEKLDVIVIFEGPGAHGRQRSAAARSRAAVGEFELTREFAIIDGFQASMTAAQIRALSQVAGVLRIQENGEVTAFDTYSNDDTGATFARGAYAVDGSSATVCVLDTGINPNHEQFDSMGLTSADFRDFTPNALADPYDDHGHGSHVAGIIAGDGQGSSSLADDAIGVAPGASLKIGKVLNAQGSGPDAQVIAGIEWCAGLADVDIVSMSLGGPTTDGTDAISLAVNCAADPGFSASCGPVAGNPKIVVVAAGNSGAQPNTIGAPGVAQNAITVGSFAEWSGDPARVWQDDGVYLNPFSSRGPVTDGLGNFKWHKPDIAAVGSGVLSAYINDAANPSPTAYASASGTSMATPLISGIVALMLDGDSSLRLADTAGLPHQKVRGILQATAIDRGAAGMDDEYGHGLVDAFAAVAEAVNPLSYAPTAYPGYTWLPGESVTKNSTSIYPFEITANDVGYPVNGTVTIDGQLKCAFMFFGSCLSWYWSPDLELVVEHYSGGSWSQVTARTTGSAEVTRSECPATGECGGVGRVEVVHFIPDVTGSYRFVVYPSAGDPNNGTGGNYDFEISMGAPDSDTANDAPTASIGSPANGDSFIQNDPITFSGSANDAEDGDVTSSLAWTSDLDGSIGSGGSFTTSSLRMGVHKITASATDSGGKTGSASITVTVTDATGNLPPTAGFGFTTSGLSASFTDSSTDSDGSIATWSWNFGDGTTSTSQNPSHTYATGATYEVSLTVTDNNGGSDSITQSVTVKENTPPTASFNVQDGPDPCGGWLDNRCTFTDTSTDSDGSIASWNWHWGSGSLAGCNPCSGSGQSMLVDFPANGPNPTTVSLTVTDNEGATTTMSVEVTLSKPANAAPTADFTFSTTDLTANFTDASSDSDGSIASWAWDFGDTNTSTAQNPSHGYASGGTYTVSLTVTDDDGATGTTSQTVTVSDPANAAPTAGFSFSTSNLTASFTDSSTDPDGADDIVSWSWDFGVAGTSSDTSSAQNPSYTYPDTGTYTVTLTVTDTAGASGTTSQQVSVTAPNSAPTAGFSFATSELTANFTDSSTDPDGAGDIASWAWDFGVPSTSSDTSSAQNPSYTYPDTGTYTVTLTVTDTAGASGTTSQQVSVTAPPGAGMHVGDIDATGVNEGKTWTAFVTIHVHDGSEGAVSSAKVLGSWSNGAAGTTSCVTSGGNCTVSIGGMRKNNSFVTFTVTGVTHASLTYDGAANHDADGDSNGTVINAPKP